MYHSLGRTFIRSQTTRNLFIYRALDSSHSKMFRPFDFARMNEGGQSFFVDLIGHPALPEVHRRAHLGHSARRKSVDLEQSLSTNLQT